jgi:hypothetical protein
VVTKSSKWDKCRRWRKRGIQSPNVSQPKINQRKSANPQEWRLLSPRNRKALPEAPANVYKLRPHMLRGLCPCLVPTADGVDFPLRRPMDKPAKQIVLL